jgi:predicted NBD/HSP70 family sugar kinase
MSRRAQPGVPTLLRALNDRAALELLVSQGPLTRAQLSELTGLSRVTAHHSIERLESRGLVQQVGVQAGGRGPNAQVYAVVPTAAYVVAVEVGPRKVTAAGADITGTMGARIELDADGTDDPVEVVHNAVVKVARRARVPVDRVRQVVLGTPGVVDPATGDIAFSWDLPRWHRGLVNELRADLRRPVTIENDVNLAAIAEFRTGAAQDVDDFVLLWVARGLGLAVVLGGRLHRGATGGAGEIGYLPVPGGPLAHEVSRRVKGSFQRLAGADSVRALARAHGFRAAGAAEAVRAAAEAGTDGDALLTELARRLALGVAGVCVVLDPALVVLAGDICQAGGDSLATRVGMEVAAIAPVSPRVVSTAVPADPVLHGALITAVDRAREEVFASAADGPAAAAD